MLEKKPIKVFTAFSGYDSQCMALDKLGIKYDLVGWSEINKYAIQAHNAIYPQYAARNYGDIRTINWNNVPTFELFTYSFPCQDISIAGGQKGLCNGTRSNLLYECKKAIENKMPKYLIMENVKALTQKRFSNYLNNWQRYLENLGYTCFTKVLNAKDYGIPQSRERVFMVSILHSDAIYNFPESIGLQKQLSDILEHNVSADYYLNAKAVTSFIPQQASIKINDTINKVKAIGYTRNAQGIVVNRFFKDVINTLKATHRGSNQDVYIAEPKQNGFAIRKLTPRENFRFMGVNEADIDKIQAAGICNTQQCRMAGNSIVVDVLYYIFKNLLTTKYIQYD